MRPSVRKLGSSWQAVHRDQRDRIVWSCTHRHLNRNLSTGRNGMSALDCAHGVTEAELESVIVRGEKALALLCAAYEQG